MEVPADLSIFFEKSIVRLDTAFLKKYNPRKFPVISSMIDKMGKLSAEAQRLKRSLTTYDKLLDSEDQFLYVLWEQGTKPNQSFLIGLLKIGYKHLYLYDRSMRLYKVKPLCVLDFYVHSSKQRQGYGHRLYDYVLEHENIAAAAVAIDKPSDSLLAFLKKHYGLTNPIMQATNFVVYPEFFHIIDADKDSLNGREREKSPDHKSEQSNSGFTNSSSRPQSGVASALASVVPAPAFAASGDTNRIALTSNASVSSAHMAKGRKIISMDHQHLW